MAEELGCREARAMIEQALAQCGVTWAWIELSSTTASREDQLGTHLTTLTWRVSLEAHMPDGMGNMRHQIIDESAQYLSQAVARIVDRIAAKTGAQS
jgi:hypothetical protein